MSAMGSVIVMVTWSTFLAAVHRLRVQTRPPLRRGLDGAGGQDGRVRAYSEVMKLGITSWTCSRQAAHRGEPSRAGRSGRGRTCGTPRGGGRNAGTGCNPGP